MQAIEPKVARHRGIVADLRVGGRSPVRIVVVVPGHVDEAKDVSVIEEVLLENSKKVRSRRQPDRYILATHVEHRGRIKQSSITSATG